MSVQFGRWNFDGRPLAPEYICKVGDVLAPYGPDSNSLFSDGSIHLLYRAFHTTTESWQERQPYISASGTIFLWDGRLDNRNQFLQELRNCPPDSTDVSLVAAAFQKWGLGCFEKVIGDWALSIWEPLRRCLTLATDAIGARHLYYLLEPRQFTWSTNLDPLVLFAEKSFTLSEEYLAGYFVNLAAPHLTPYEEILCVPPSSFVTIRPECHTITKYWDFDAGKKIRYRSNSDYEEHFRAVFSTAVRRRLRSDRPVLAELSGGIDSSAIVCMADWMFGHGKDQTARLDTISYFDDSDPTLNERAYIIKVEERRGRSGYHIDVGAKRNAANIGLESHKSISAQLDAAHFIATPYFSGDLLPEVFDEYESCIRARRYRVTLSGSAGEDVTGGYIPSPKLELQDLFLGGRLIRMCRQLNSWASVVRKPRSVLLREAFSGFLDRSLTSPWSPKIPTLPFWFQSAFIDRNRHALSWYPGKLRIFGGLPSFQHQVQLFRHQQRFLAISNPRSELLREIRYPYLDRDLLEFACAIPREQLVGVGKRRFLMKRSLAGIVPDELLNRKRTSAPTIFPRQAGSEDWSLLDEPGHHFLTARLGIINPELLVQALEKARRSENVSFEHLRRTILLECWLRYLESYGILRMPTPAIYESQARSYSSPFSRVRNFKSSAS